MFPLIVRALDMLPWALGCDGLTDLVSPYGYGGPYSYGHPNAGLFWDSFAAWAQSTNVVSCFVRLGLFPQHQIAFCGNVEIAADNVVRSLSPSDETIWREYEHKVRKNVNKAQRSGLVVMIDSVGEKLEDFLSIYYATMARREATKSYYFPRTFFESIISRLQGSFAFFHCLAGDDIVSSELVLTSASTVYSFLGGTLPDAFDVRPNDLLKHSITLWAKELGMQNFVLGGGYMRDDGIYRYKRSFVPHGVVPFYVGKRIENESLYRELVTLRRSWEAQQAHIWEPSPAFFPEYRA